MSVLDWIIAARPVLKYNVTIVIRMDILAAIAHIILNKCKKKWFLTIYLFL